MTIEKTSHRSSLRRPEWLLIIVIVMMTHSPYGMRLHADAPVREKNAVIIINDEVFKKTDIQKGVNECCAYTRDV